MKRENNCHEESLKYSIFQLRLDKGLKTFSKRTMKWNGKEIILTSILKDGTRRLKIVKRGTTKGGSIEKTIERTCLSGVSCCFPILSCLNSMIDLPLILILATLEPLTTWLIALWLTDSTKAAVERLRERERERSGETQLKSDTLAWHACQTRMHDALSHVNSKSDVENINSETPAVASILESTSLHIRVVFKKISFA